LRIEGLGDGAVGPRVALQRTRHATRLALRRRRRRRQALAYLTDGARADSVPNLEIETGEIVGAGHASATGRFDDEQLFYLQARGITEHEARRLVVRGFFADIVQRIGVPAVQEHLMAAIDAELSLSIGAGPEAVRS